MNTSNPRRRRVSRSNILSFSEIKVPILDDAVPPIIEGYIPREYLDSDIEVVIEELWPESAPEGSFDVLVVHWRRSGSEGEPLLRRRFNGPIDPAIFPLRIPVDRRYLENDGTVLLSYEVLEQGTLPTSSPTRVLVLDRTPPNNNIAPQVPEFPVSIIDEDYLAENPTVNMRIPFYTGRRAWDRVEYYLSDETPPPERDTPDGFFDFVSETEPLVFPVPGDLFRLYRNGLQYMHIVLRDRSGNPGPRSIQTPVIVDLDPSPSDLQALVVPAMVNGLIDRQDARLGVVGKVLYDNWQEGDHVTVTWGAAPLSPQPVTQLPLDVSIPWETLIAQGLGQASGVATYTITRTGGTLPTPPSPPTVIRWNFTVAGQDHGDAPQLLNLDLPAVMVWGEGSMTENLIDIRDQDQRIYASVPLYHRPQDGEKLTLYWGNFPSTAVPVAHYTVDVSKGDAEGSIVEFSDIPWNVITGAGNNDRMPVYYTTSNGVNEQLANFTNVTVAVVPILSLTQVQFPSATADAWINCQTVPPMWDHIPLGIPGNTQLREGDAVLLSWQGYEGFFTGPIDGTEDSLLHFLSAEEAKKGYTFKQDNYEEKIKPIRSDNPASVGSSALVSYEVLRGTRIIGRARERQVKIDQRYSSGRYCGPDEDGEQDSPVNE
ncbi:hypothetical protein ACI51W_30010 [Pseudomonas marginalis]|uniref:hypothetical protein n=1 Tax=Pseudomonas marginalis TaxID=298 RepID=UPI0038647797